jgi:hypothetical protein
MISEPIRLEEVSVLRRVAPRISFVAALALSLAALASAAHAQTNIDQGKSSAEIFANDCAACHKTTRGLAAGRNSLMLSGFLREHYTASRDQAAALAAYVLGAGGGSGPAPPPPSQKPGTDRTRAAVEEPKSGEPGTAEPRTPESKREPKTAARPTHPSAKPEEETRPVTASRGHKQEPEPAVPAQEPAAIVAAPAASETPRSAEAPGQDANPTTSAPTAGAPTTIAPTTSAAAPAESQPSDSESVPRDNIPD